jgi:hypothetical protein
MTVSLYRRHWPVAPLEKVIFAKFPPGKIGQGNNAGGLSSLPMTFRREIYRSRHYGGLTGLMADEFAVLLGKHPSEIWTDWFEDE